MKKIILAILDNQFVKQLGTFIALLLALFLLFDWIIMPIYTRHGAEMEMPNITRLRYEDAKRVLEEQNFSIVTDEERYSARFPAGYVIEQTPPPHSKVKGGRRVYVVVSRGLKRVFVPKLVERSQRDADLLLRQAGLILGKIDYEHSNIHPQGVITKQSIPPNVEVSVETRIDVVVSMGHEPSEFVVPSVEGRTYDDAARRIKQAGLIVGEITYTVVPDLLPETVIHQSIEADMVVAKGTAIDLELSALPER